MWPFRRNPKHDIPRFDVDNIIAAGTTVHGDLRGTGAFRVDGVVKGSVEADGAIVIGETGTVEGNVRGRQVVVLGRVQGGVSARGHLEIGPKGKVLGDVAVQSFRMHKGGVFDGTSRMMSESDEPSGPTAALPPGPPPRRLGSGKAAPPNKGQKGRTLPPPTGAVPPPPATPEPGPVEAEGAPSRERLATIDLEDVVESPPAARSAG